MARPLSNIEYVTFLSDVKPDTLGLPDWGGMAQWGGLYVLMFKMPSGEWALSDVTDGIPFRGTVVMPADYLKNIPGEQTSNGAAFIYSLPQSFMTTALTDAAAVGNLASGYIQWTTQQIADALKPFGGVLPPIGPIVVAALVLLALIYLPKPRRG